MFCRTRLEVDELTETLNGRGYRAEALHGGMTQEARDRVMKRFKNKQVALLVWRGGEQLFVPVAPV